MIGKTNAVIGGSGGGVDEQLINYTMLYDAGDECVDLTRGYSAYPYVGANWSENTAITPTLTKNSDSMSITMPSQGLGSVFVEQAIDLSNYSGVCVNYSCPNFHTDGEGAAFNTIKIALSATKANNYQYPTELMLCNGTMNGADGIAIMDISNIIGNYFLLFYMFYHNTASPSATIYNVFLVKEDDWQTWLEKGGLTVADYASLDEVIADTEALSTLMNNANAVNYMLKKCTGTVMASVIQSSDALSAIRDSQYNAEIFANEHWCKFLEMVGETAESSKLYLYNEGDECVDVSTGWSFPDANSDTSNTNNYFDMLDTSYGTRTVKKNSDHIFMSVTQSERYRITQSSVHTNKAIDLSSYSKICVDYDANSVAGTGTAFKMVVSAYTTVPDSMTQDQYYNYVFYKKGHESGRNIFEIDISDITTSVYINFDIMLYSESYNIYGNAKIYRAWLE